MPRSRLDQDSLYSLGGFLTICRTTRNDAEALTRAIAANDWQSSKTGTAPVKPANAKAKPEEQTEEDVPTEEGGAVNLEQLARDSIARMIDARFKGHGLGTGGRSILSAQGYSTHRSPDGADHGVGILSGAGAMGFGSPRNCVQVKSGDSPIDRPSVDQLVGTIQHVGADHGLFVAWGGFKVTVNRELAQRISGCACGARRTSSSRSSRTTQTWTPRCAQSCR